MPSGCAKKGVLSDSSTPHSAHLRFLFFASKRRASAICFAFSRSALFSADSAMVALSPPESELHSFDEHGDPLPAADACAADAVLCSAPLQLVQEVNGDAGPRGRERVAEGDRSAVDVRLLARQAEVFL